MFDLEIYTEKFAESGRRLIRKSYEEARSRDHNQVAPEHVLISIAEVERPFFNEVMQSLNLDPQVVLQALEMKLGQRDYIGRGMKMSESLRTLLANALKHAHERGRRNIESTDLFVALFKDLHSFPVEVLRRLGADREMVMQKIQTRVRSHEEKEEKYRRRYELPPYLKHFGVSLNKLARQDKLPPVIGRSEEIRQMIEILCHRERANSPMLVGEAGVGKTAVVEVAVVGSEEIYPKIGEARLLARLTGAPYFPLTPTFPWLGPLGIVPLPSKWRIEFCDPIDTTSYGPEAADDRALVFELSERVRATIQEKLYENLVKRGAAFSPRAP